MTDTDLIQCEWPGCHETYLPAPPGLMPQARDLHEAGWLVAYYDNHLSCCPEHAEQGWAYNRERLAARNAYALRLTDRCLELLSQDSQAKSLLEDIWDAGIRHLEVPMTLELGSNTP